MEKKRPTELLIKQSFTITFNNSNDEVIGELTWVDGKLVFTGNAEESAKIFFDEVIKNYLDNKKGGG